MVALPILKARASVVQGEKFISVNDLQLWLVDCQEALEASDWPEEARRNYANAYKSVRKVLSDLVLDTSGIF